MATSMWQPACGNGPFAGTLAVSLTGIFYAVTSARRRISRQKATYRLRAYVLVGIAICLGGILMLCFQAQLPIFVVTGTIKTAVVRPEGRGPSHLLFD